MTLTEYELADLAMNWQATTTPTTALFVTIASGYLIAAWMVGERLTRAQVTLINFLFGIFQLGVLSGWAGRWIQTYDYTSALTSIDPAFYGTGPTAVLVLFGSVMLISIPGCLKFMWDIRHPKAD
jgi:hypothetical protein